MRPSFTRVIRITFESNPDPDHPWKRQTRIVAVILYPIEVKRQLATVDNAKACAVELARQIIERDCFRPPILEALNCSVEVTLYHLRPLQRPHWILEDGTKVWLAEVERDLDCPSRPAQWDRPAERG
jgi:hypothetical protein